MIAALARRSCDGGRREQACRGQGADRGSGGARGRDPCGDSTLIAVSKTFDADGDRAGARGGQREFGENRVQEARGSGRRFASAIPISACISSGRCRPTRCATRWRCSTRSIRSIATSSLRQLAEGDGAAGAKASRSSCRSTPARSRRRPASRRAEAADSSSAAVSEHGLVDRGTDVHPAARRRSRAAFRDAETARRGARAAVAVDGDERGFRGGDRARRHACPGRQRDLWRAGLKAEQLSAALSPFAQSF